MSPKHIEWFLDFCTSVLEAHFTTPKPEEEQQRPMKEIVWEIGPDGYLRGR